MKKNLSLKYILMITFVPIIVLFVVGLFINNYVMMKNDINRLINNKLKNISESLSMTLNASVDNSIKNYLRGYGDAIQNLIDTYYKLYRQGIYATRQQTIRKIIQKITKEKATAKECIFIVNIANLSKIKFIIKPDYKISKKDVANLISQSVSNINGGYYELISGNRKKVIHSIYYKYSNNWKWMIFISALKKNVKSLINIQELSSQINSIKIGGSGFAGVINYQGVMLIHPFHQDENVINQKDLKGQYIYKKILKEKNGELIFYWDYGKGVKKNILYFRDIKQIGHIVFITSPYDFHYKTLNTTRNIVVITLLIFILIIIPLINGLSSIIVKPFSLLINTFDEITRNLEFKKVSLEGNKEVSKLSKYFNLMIEEIGDYSSKLEKSIKNEKDINEKLEAANEELQASYEELEATQEELEQVNYDLANTLARVEEASKMKSEFLAILSHELRTPLTGMLGFSEVLLKNKDLTEKQNKYVEFIHRAGKRLLAVISDLLEISSIEAGKIKIEYREFDIEKVIADIAILFNEKMNSKNIKLFYNLNGINRIYSDPARLRQILFNIVGNAIKFTEKGDVIIELKKYNNNYIFEIIDKGIGIGKENLNKIFDMFKQVESAYKRYYGGVGLGLAICKKLVEALNGEIWVESEPGKGSKFGFSLPIPQHENKQIEKEDSENITAEKSKAKIKILFAEDDLINNELIQSILKVQDNITYKGFYNGKDLLEEYKNNNDYNIIIADIHMPYMDGLELLKKVRKINKNIPIIALTAFAADEDEKKYISKGFTDYISKPIETKFFIEKIEYYSK